MRVLGIVADSAGCGFYRMTEPARAVNESGLAEVILDDGLDAEMIGDEVHSIKSYGADLVVFQRPAKLTLLKAIRAFKKQGVRVVVELDDDLERVAPSNMAYNYYHPKQSPDENWQILKESCYEADWLTVSTPALTRYGRQGRVSVVRNRVSREITQIEHTGGNGVGWSGTLAVHSEDLNETRGGLSTFEMYIVGDGRGVKKALLLPSEPKSSGWLALPAYYAELATLDVGVAPLSDTSFNRAKSYLKIMEFAALEVPFVCSPSDEYLKFVADAGFGHFAKKPRDWKRHVQSLMNDPDARAEAGSMLRAHVVKNHLVENAADEWVNAWKNAFRA